MVSQTLPSPHSSPASPHLSPLLAVIAAISQVRSRMNSRRSPDRGHYLIQEEIERILIPRSSKGDIHGVGTSGAVFEYALDSSIWSSGQSSAKQPIGEWAPLLAYGLFPLNGCCLRWGQFERQIRRTLDARSITILAFARRIEHRSELGESLWGQVRGIPSIGIASDHRDGPVFADATVPDRHLLLHWARQIRCILDMKVVSVKGGAILGEQTPDQLDSSSSISIRVPSEGKVIAVGHGPLVRASRAETQLEATAGEMVECGCCLGDET